VRRILVWSNDPVGRTLAGPGIRYLNFARELQKAADVTLAAPETPVGETFATVRTADLSQSSLRGLVGSVDAIVAQELPPRLAVKASRAGVRLILDLYGPALVESLAHLAAEPGGLRVNQLRYDEVRFRQLAGLRLADGFLCATARQRDLWLGALSSLGRLSVGGWLADPTFADLVTIVPFGLDAEPPSPGAPALRGVVPGISSSDLVLLWGGGVWNWFDPLTVIDAVARLVTAGHDEVKLFFLGTRHPSSAVDQMAMLARARDRATTLRLDGTHVFFNDGWVPHGERRGYLLEADLGVSAHFDTLETRFAFRTRLLDCFWAGLPVVCTGGDALGELIRERDAGIVLPERDVEAWAAALTSLAESPAKRKHHRRRIESLRDEFTWQRVCAPLVELLTTDGPPRSGTPRPRGVVLRSSIVALRSSLVRRGAVGTARAALGRTRRERS
jgi:glycosyltransferase involved in cell wall biosynthesis